MRDLPKFTVILEDGTTFQAGYYRSGRKIPPDAMPNDSDATTYWTCGAFESYRKQGPSVQRSYFGLELWLAAPTRAEALRRLREGFAQSAFPEMDSFGWCTGFDWRMPNALKEDPLLMCSIDTQARAVVGAQEKEPHQLGQTTYLCVQRLIVGFNDEWSQDYRAARQLAANLREMEIEQTTPSGALGFDNLPGILRKNIAKVRNSAGFRRKHPAVKDYPDCWIWNARESAWDGSVDTIPDSYGRFHYDGQEWPTHRLIYTLLRGEIPMSAVLRHQCHRKRCCNPDHLIPGSHRQNRNDTVNLPRSRYRWK